MSALTSLLVRDQVVSVRKIEEAIQRQVIYGGDLETVLLEMNAVPEDVMSAYRAATYGLSPATREEVTSVPKEILRMFPRELAQQHRMIPVGIEGRRLTVASSAPLPVELDEQIGFLLGFELVPKIITEVRLSAALEKHYGVSMDPYIRGVLEKVDSRDPGRIPNITPAAQAKMEREKAQGAKEARPPFGSWMSAPAHEVHWTSERQTSKFGFKALAEEVLAAQQAAEAQKEQEQEEPVPAVEPATSTTPQAVHADSSVGVTRVVGVGRGSSRSPKIQTPEPSRWKSVETYDFSTARELLKHAAERDEVLRILLDVARAFFDYSALFAVHEDIAAGRDAAGTTGSIGQAIRRIAIPLDVPGVFADIRKSMQPAMVDLNVLELDRIVANDLQRVSSQPAIVLPLVLRQRTVAMLYGDRGGESLSLEDIAPLIEFLPEVSERFERIILARKNRPGSGQNKKHSTAPPPAPASQPPTAGTYSVRHVAPEHVPRATAKAASEPPKAPSAPPKTPSVPPPPPTTSEPPRSFVRSPDSRREQPDEALTHDVVPPRGTLPASPPGQPAGRPSMIVEEPSVIVDMGPNIDSLIDDLCKSSPDQDGTSMQSMLDAGELALPVLVQRFPGPLWFDRLQPHRRLPRGRDVSAIARALVSFGERAVPYVASLLASRDTEIRFYATLLVAEFLHRDLVAPTTERLFDTDANIRALALDVFRMFRPLTKQFNEALEMLRSEVSVPRKDTTRRPVAIRALGELRDEKSVKLLVELLRLQDRELVAAARRSLVLLTRQDFADSHKKWVTWLEKNQDRHRVEWLIDALLHNEEEMRTAAADELKQLTQQYFGYHPGLPKREREVVQKKYRTWWEGEGRKRFS